MTENLQQATPQEGDWGQVDSATQFFDPLLESLVILARMEGRPVTADALVAGLPLDDGRLTPELFPRAAHRAGLSARLIKRGLGDITPLVLPVVLLCHARQACILVAIDREQGKARVVYSEAGAGEEELGLKELESRYAGYAFYVKPEHRFDERATDSATRTAGHWFWGTLWKSWRIYRDVLLASFLINLFALASPLFVKNVYDRVVPNNAIETLWVLAVGISIVVLFDILMKMLRGYFIDLAGKKSDILLSARIFEQVLGLRMEAKPASVGAFANNLREFESIRDFITSASVATLVDLPFVALFLFVVWLIGGPVVWVGVSVLLLVALYGVVVQRPLRESVESTYRASAQKGAMLIETLSGLESIKFLGAEGPLQRQWEQLTGHIAKWSIRSRVLSSSATNVAAMLQQLSQVGVVVVGVYLITDGELSMGGLIACTMLTGRAVAPMGQLANLAVRYFHAKTALDTLNNVMEMPVDRPEDKTFLSRPALEGEIEFDHVGFNYPGNEVASLDDVSFRIRPGERVALIGRIGSGKSTIAKLVLGLYEPTQGAVRIDGIDVRQINPTDLRRNVGYVAQEPVLFFGSVRENITMGALHVDDEEILRAANAAEVTPFVQRHPLGFDMPVGERGENLSGGQRQSIAVARALINAPGVFVMDEPTNSMDNTTESILKKNLASVVKGKTALIATHRSSLLELVDRIIVMDKGCIVADGEKEVVVQLLKEGRLKTG